MQIAGWKGVTGEGLLLLPVFELAVVITGHGCMTRISFQVVTEAGRKMEKGKLKMGRKNQKLERENQAGCHGDTEGTENEFAIERRNAGDNIPYEPGPLRYCVLTAYC